MIPPVEETPYVTRDEVRRLLAESVDAMTEGICARLAAAPAGSSPVPNITPDQLFDEVARRLKPHLEEAIRKTLVEASLVSGEPRGRRLR